MHRSVVVELVDELVVVDVDDLASSWKSPQRTVTTPALFSVNTKDTTHPG